MKLSKILSEEINSYDSVSPNVKIFVDSSSLFWVTKDNEFIWLQDHSGIDNYIDENHIQVEGKNPEGVNNEGVYWMNEDFENPFHITDFTDRIAEINAIRN